MALIPAKGQVFVDGEPAFEAFVHFHPVTPHKLPDPKKNVSSHGQVDAAGDFAVSTYEQGDGLPLGEYKISLTWNARSGLSQNQFGGPDRLKGQFKDPETTGFTLSVNEDSASPIEIPAFILNLEGGEEKKK